jgi:hypothetical protein
VLGDLDVPVFYPSMFVLVTEVLDTFGQLVFDRIRNRSIEVHQQEQAEQGAGSGMGAINDLKGDFTPADIHIKAKETCRNWLYKIACIRELLPRLYIEIALVRCYQFLSEKEEYVQILQRLANVIRGIGDPLMAVYVQTEYLYIIQCSEIFTN